MQTGNEELSMIPVKRNPYLAEYERARGGTRNQGRTGDRGSGEPSSRGRVHSSWQQAGQSRTNVRKQAYYPNPRRLTAARRRRRVMIQRLAFSLGLITLTLLGISLLVKNNRAAAADNPQNFAGANRHFNAENLGGLKPADTPAPVETTVQGIPADVFARHPDWKEDFLTPNEYSRPGDELKEVKNIFVHYTANPGTSAAQNRSYFERQKDEHKASVSSHFIIGYEGEIIQCVPLTEIAYAVQTRNFDSVSIECCYKAKDGSFTQETYDSLISLLAWLIDVYDLDTEDILRHYDCGGKKCPLYYTNNPDKWVQLKKDVGNAKTGGTL